jgi:CRISPR-associated protein Cmr2
MQQQGMLIFPAPLGDDVPNKLVARVPLEEAETIAEAAKKALLHDWIRIADTAKRELMAKSPTPDVLWHDIWMRQTAHLWEIYWAAAPLENRSYKVAYEEASRALDAVKHTRGFEASEEEGAKDTLSGCREAMHTTTEGAKEYWTEVSEQVKAAKLRPGGRERLDAIGAVKRFSEIADKSRIPSTSTVASHPFLHLVREKRELAEYRQAVEELLKGYLYRPNAAFREWPYDGDLLFAETLTEKHLEHSYGALDPGWLQPAQDALREVYQHVKVRPSPYYGIIAMDGDDMGKRVSACLQEPEPEKAHTELSRKLAVFATQVKSIVAQQGGELIYNGGDDVLALAPLSTAFDLAQCLARTFAEVTNGTASAGVVIAHHLYPLDAALQAARAAEHQAKQVKEKDAICVQVLKRSGEMLAMRSPWNAVGDTLTEIIQLFKGDAQGEPLSGKLAHDVVDVAYALPDADEKCRAELKRLLKRHRNPKHSQAPEPDVWAERLKTWATHLPNQLEELGHWLVFARFVAQGGSE